MTIRAGLMVIWICKRERERLMNVHRQKPSYLQRKRKDEVNKKALIWTGSILAAIVILMTVLLIINR